MTRTTDISFHESEVTENSERRELLAQLARQFEESADAGFDWEALREVKGLAWPSR